MIVPVRARGGVPVEVQVDGFGRCWAAVQTESASQVNAGGEGCSFCRIHWPLFAALVFPSVRSHDEGELKKTGVALRDGSGISGDQSGHPGLQEGRAQRFANGVERNASIAV